MARNLSQVRGVMVAGSTALLALSIWLTFYFIEQRAAGNTDVMLLTASTPWFEPLNIAYSVGVDGISVVMLLLSSIIVFTGTFASWQLKPMTKEYFLWFTLLSTGVYGFFICTDMFTMFMFYEVALIPMYLLIGVWGSGRKEYSAMKLTLMLMGGSALLILGILGIYYFNGVYSGEFTMNVNEIAKTSHAIPLGIQSAFFPFIFIGFGVLGALFPFHTWSPDGHASAPTAVSMLHAGRECAVDDGDRREDDEDPGEFLGCVGQQVHSHAEAAVASELHQHAGVQHRHSRGGRSMTVGRPSVEREQSSQHTETDEDEGEEGVLDADGWLGPAHPGHPGHLLLQRRL